MAKIPSLQLSNELSLNLHFKFPAFYHIEHFPWFSLRNHGIAWSDLFAAHGSEKEVHFIHCMVYTMEILTINWKKIKK